VVKTIEQKYKKLSEVEHVLLRPGRYIGSISPHTEETYVYDLASKRMVKKTVTYNPGFLKIFDEIISNSVDHSKRPEGKHLDIIRVEVDAVKGEISIYDNGGIPVVKHKEYNQWVPEMIFELRAGSNFDDDDQAMLTGQNGEGAALTNIFSEWFVIETCDGTKKFKMTFEDHSQNRKNPRIQDADGSKGYTRVSYKPDIEKLGCTFDDDNMTMLLKRVVDIAGLNTHLKVYWNGERIPTRTFKDYIELYVGPDGEYAYDETDTWKVAVAASDGEFQHISFVNGTHTKVGGTHILYAGMQIWEAIREHIKKKHKVDVKPAELRQHMTLFIDAQIVNPRYASQTKEDLITEQKDYKTSWTVPDKMIRKILQSSIIQAILDWAEAKAHAEELRNLRKLNNETGKADPRRVDKFNDAQEKHQRRRCILFLAEGDSAAKSLFAATPDRQFIGTFPLKGKPLNVREKEVSRVLGLDKKREREKEGKKTEPNEIQKILTIIGLQIGVPVNSLDELRFGRIAFATDADVDGAHISGLLMNLFDHFWPELFKMGFVHILRTPVVKVFVKDKVVQEFFTEREFKDWVRKDGQKLRGWTHRYFKGLGTTKTVDFKPYMENLDKYLFRITMEGPEDKAAIDLAFNGERADDRKTWLETPAENFEDFIVSAQ
jgi:DNA gyrase/topoisomerase IV subunit B